MSKKKVLMVHNFYQIGGGEHTVFKNEVEMLRENGHEVIEYTRGNDELKKSKFKLLLLPFTTIWSWKSYKEVKKIIKEENIDVVHCHNTFPLISPSVYYAAHSQKVPVVQTIHNFRFLCPCGVFYRDGRICEDCLNEGTFKSAVKHKCYRNSKIQTMVVATMLRIHRKMGTYNRINYIFLTEFNKQKFGKLIDIRGNNVFIKPNFVNHSPELEFKQCAEKTFIFASRLEENKGIKFLIEQWKKMPSEYKLHIYGAGPLEQYVQEQVQNNSNIQYLGFKTHDEIFKDMKQATAMIFPTLGYEGYPMIIAESMSIGCPVVSTNIGNAGSIVKSSKGGVLFDLNLKNSLKNAIENCVINHEELSFNAYQFYKEKMSKQKNYEQVIDIYNNLEI